MNEPTPAVSTNPSDPPPGVRRSWLYRLTFTGATVVAAIAVVFFFIGLADGSVSSFNMTLWLGLLGAIAAIVFFGYQLNAHGHSKAAVALLSVLALPGLLYGLFLVLVVTSGARWN